MQGYLSLDGLRAFLVVVLAVGQALAAFWPDLRGWKNTISTRSAALGNPVVPVPPTFAIWGLIFLSCAAFAAWQALPGNLDDPLLSQIGWIAICLFAGNIVWELWVPKNGLDWASVAIIAVELILVFALLFIATAADLDGWTWWLVAFPFQLFAGWVSAAFFVNLSSTLLRPFVHREDANGGTDPRRPAVALALIGSAIILGLIAAFASGAWPYALAVCWALGGIVVTNLSKPTIAGTAVAGAVFIALAVFVSPANAQTQIEEPSMSVTKTPDLEIAYLARGPESGPVVIFLHGFPDDATGWLPVMDRLADQGIRSYAPFLRGFGATRFLAPDTPRSGQVAALVNDLRAFMDALEIETATLVGQDWGARAAQGVAALHPERVDRLVSYGGYAITWGEADGPPPYPVMQTLWYQHLLNMPFAEGVLRGDTEGFSRHLWSIWSPGWDHGARNTAFDEILVSLQNPDFVPVVLSGYSYTAQGYDDTLRELEDALDAAPTINVPTIIIRGAQDPLETPEEFANDAATFSNIIRSITLPDAGHFAHREEPERLIEILTAE